MTGKLTLLEKRKIKHDVYAQLLIIRGFSQEIEHAVSELMNSALLTEQGNIVADLQKIEMMLDEDICQCVGHIILAEKNTRRLIGDLRSVESKNSATHEG